MKKRQNIRNRAACLGIVLVVTGCAAFLSHEELASQLRIRNDYGELVAELQGGALDTDTNQLLLMQEHGRLHMLNGNPQAAQSAFAPVVRHYRNKDFEPLVSLEDTLDNVAATTVSNDQAIQYSGSGFERVFAHHYQAMVFLQQNNIENALIEIRAARFAQQRIETLRQKEVLAAESGQGNLLYQLKQKELVAGDVSFDQESLSHLDAMANDQRKAFLNLYTYLFIAAAYEALGNEQEALIDYRKAYNIDPTNRFAVDGILRLGPRLNPAFVASVQAQGNFEPWTDDPDHGVLLLFVENDFVPPRYVQSTYVNFLSSQNRYRMTWPAYADYQPALVPAYLGHFYHKTGSLVEKSLEPVIATLPLAVDQLNRAMPAILLRQFSRLLLQSATNEIGMLPLQLGFSLLSNITNRADTRTWLTLPEHVLAAAFSLPAGQHRMVLSRLQIGIIPQPVNLSLNIAPGQVRLLVLSDIVGRQVVLTDFVQDTFRIPDVTLPPEETTSDDTSPDETSPDETSPDETSPDDTSPDETASDDTSPDDTQSDE